MNLKSLSVKNILAINKVKRAINIGKEVFDSAVIIAEAEKKVGLTVAKEGFKFLNKAFENKTVWGMGSWTRWNACPYRLTKFIVELASQKEKPIIVKASNSEESSKLLTIEGIQFLVEDENRLYYDSEVDQEKVYAAVGRLILDSVGFRCCYFSGNNSSLSSSESSKEHSIIPVEETEVLVSDTALEIMERITPFLEKKINRSIFLHGPPGTGKSCIAEYIADTMNGVYLSFGAEELRQLTTDQVIFAIKLLGPDIIVINDIDRGLNSIDSFILTTLEELNRVTKLIIVTANSVQVTPAIIRPGRFDEVIEVTQLGEATVKTMVKNIELTPEIFEIVKTWPAAFIEELKLRVETLGQDCLEKEVAELSKRIKYNNGEPLDEQDLSLNKAVVADDDIDWRLD